MLTVYESLPDGLLEQPAARLHEVLPGPALIHMPGRRPEPLFVSVLLHGNEDTGWQAMQAVLRKHAARGLPRALSLFIGNVEAARSGLRRLDGQVDYNRVWPGATEADLREHAMMQEVVEAMRQRRVFASIDIHNNTGLNPHYACINSLEQPFLHLATLFSRIVVYFLRPLGVQSAAFAQLCPAVTIECGKPGVSRGVEHAAEYVEACLNLSEIPIHAVAPHDLDLFHTVATVKVPDEIALGFGEGDWDICFDAELDHLNFRELEPGVVLGRIRGEAKRHLVAFDEQGRDVTERCFEVRNDAIRMRRRLMPSMLTRDERVIRQDCLCYLMERLPYPA